MAILFSHVTLSNEYYGTTELLVSGYPQDADDLQGWCAFDDYMDEVEDSCAIDVHVEAYRSASFAFCGRMQKEYAGCDLE